MSSNIHYKTFGRRRREKNLWDVGLGEEFTPKT